MEDEHCIVDNLPLTAVDGGSAHSAAHADEVRFIVLLLGFDGLLLL